MEGNAEGWLRIQIDKFDQRITLSASPCHYGGRKLVPPLPGDEPSRIGLMAAARSAALCKQARLAWPGRLPITIHDGDGSSLPRHGKDQEAPDRRS